MRCPTSLNLLTSPHFCYCTPVKEKDIAQQYRRQRKQCVFSSSGCRITKQISFSYYTNWRETQTPSQMQTTQRDRILPNPVRGFKSPLSVKMFDCVVRGGWLKDWTISTMSSCLLVLKTKLLISVNTFVTQWCLKHLKIGGILRLWNCLSMLGSQIPSGSHCHIFDKKEWRVMAKY